jgi:signal transduction histidine kinase
MLGVVGGPVLYHSIDDPAKLRRVLEAALLLEADLDLPILLRHIVDEARSMTNARYGALGVLTEDGLSLSDFITVGLEVDEEERIGSRPTGLGVLGLLISDPKPIRLAQLRSDPVSYGFPPNHPPMTSFLRVPITVRDAVYGNLYLTDKIGRSEFSSDDEALIGALAIAAGIAIENARVQEVAIYEERDRLARDLHDTVIQRLFAIGLSLQSLAGNPSASGISDRLQGAIADVDNTIRQVRTSIFELASEGIGRGIRANVLSLLQELRPVLDFDVHASFEGPVDAAIPDLISEHLLVVIREAITNIGRHANATQASLIMSVDDGQCRLQVIDNGFGISESPSRVEGLGLGNLRRRAEKLYGQFEIGCPDTGGTVLSWQVPLTP